MQKITKQSIAKKVKGFQKKVKSRPIRDWIVFKIQTVKLSRKYSEKKFEKKFDIFFCNGLQYDEDYITLCYDSYQGWLSIMPGKGTGEHESFFNLLGEEEEMTTKQSIDKIYKLWLKLKKL